MKNKFSLLQYSVSAAAVCDTAAAFSQVVYTDIEPDVALDEPGESFGIDLDDDGLNDFNFFNKSFTTTVFYMDIANIKALFVGAFDTMQNGIMGSYFTLSGGGGYTYYRPYALEQNNMVGSSNNFFNDNYQTLAREVDKLDSPFEPTHDGNWYSFYGVQILDHYLGFRFTDEESVKRFGWVRCSVIDSGRTLIIHDYAFELQPDYPIFAGDTISYVNIYDQENTLGASVYSFNKNVYVHVNNFKNTKVVIHDLTGKEILKTELIDNYSTIDMSLYSAEIYLVTLMHDDKIYSKNIMIE
jgi:hypothetical protein